MSASQSNTGRGRTKDVKQDQDSDSEGSDTFPEPPLFAVNEVVYLVIPGQAQPAGPFMVSAYIGFSQSKPDEMSSPPANTPAPLRFVHRQQPQLHARILLYKQDELIELEHKLNDLDAAEQTAFHLNSRRDDQNLARKALITEIEARLHVYDEAMQVYYRQLERPAPRKRNIQSVARWLEGNKPLTVSESSFMNDWNDLVAPADQLDHGSLDAAIASIGDLLYRWRLPMFLTSLVSVLT
ncbi:MAG: hypothetical protein LQ352_005325 [Teloschistes flavicans]|nr:MAG: hypothetical protein LQ352_005325 [Teloschistes flavicans]